MVAVGRLQRSDVPGGSDANDGQDSSVKRVLSGLVDGDTIQGALLATADGLPIVHIVRPPRSEARLSAMTSALLGLCEAAAVESKIGEFSEVIIEARSGRMVAMPVAFADRTAVLLVVGDMHAPLGKVLWAARAAAKCIAAMS